MEQIDIVHRMVAQYSDVGVDLSMTLIIEINYACIMILHVIADEILDFCNGLYCR